LQPDKKILLIKVDNGSYNINMSITLKYIQNDSGRIYYRVNGQENDTTIVMVHGLAGDSRFFHNQMKYFGTMYRVISIDLPGHGRSLEYPHHTIDSYILSINEVINEEGLNSYTLLGHSMGGGICLELFKRNRKQITSMILVSTAARFPIDRAYVETADSDFDSFFDTFLGRIFSKKAGIFIIAAKKNMTRYDQQVIINDLLICSRMDYSEVLGSIDIPVLLIANTFDMMIPMELTEKIHGQIPGSRFIAFEEKGHLPFFESHEKFNSAVELFLTGKQ